MRQRSILDQTFSEFISDKVDNLVCNIDIPHAEMITKKSESFTFQFLKDSNGKLVKNEEVHNIMHRFIRFARSKGFNKYLILGAFGHGKCFCEGDLIDSLDGTSMPVEDVTAGFPILTMFQGVPSWISLERSAFFAGIRPCYELRFLSGRIQRVSANHPYFIFGNSWIEAENLEIGQYIKLVASPFGEQHHNLNHAWYLGLYIGDGSYGKIACADRCVYGELEKIASVAWLGNADYYLRGGGKILKKFGIHDRRSKIFPLCIYSFDEETLANFIAGYFDADGNVSSINRGTKFNNAIELYSINKDWLDHIQLLLLRFGIYSRVLSKIGKYKGEDHYSWRLAITRKVDIEKFWNKIPLRSCKKDKLASINFEHKAKDYSWNSPDWLYDTLVEKKFIGLQKTFGIEVPVTHTHIINGLYSHNTEQICTGFVLHEIAKNPNLLAKIVHVSETEAVKRCRAIRDYITKDDDLKRLAPHLRPTPIWGSQRFIVNRNALSKDGTVEAYGILSTAIGGRANLLIFDDPQDLRTAVLEPTMRKKIEDTFKNIWLTRLIPKASEVIVLMNKWHENDLASVLKGNPVWSWMQIAVSQDLQSLEYKDSFGRSALLPLWTKFNHDDLVMRTKELGMRDFDRGYRLIPYSDSDHTFPSFKQCCQYGISRYSLIKDQKDWVFFGGIDFASTKRPGTVLSVIAAHRYSGLKVPVELVSLRGSQELPFYIIQFHQHYGVEFYNAENNGVQEALIDMLVSSLGQEKYQRYNIKIEGFLTGRNKADPMTGLPSLEKEFENREWMFCFDKKVEPAEADAANPWHTSYFEFVHHPFYQTTDIVMSLWFAREAAKQYFRGNQGPNIF